jgi:preprotein translocase subunit Sss1
MMLLINIFALSVIAVFIASSYSILSLADDASEEEFITRWKLTRTLIAVGLIGLVGFMVLALVSN